MNTADFDLLSGLIRERSGLVLTPDKLYLLESRLTPVARKHGIEGLNELVAALRTRTDDTVLVDVVEAMTTNESFFFRDSHMFDTFRDEVLPVLIENRKSTKRLRIWCAAASSGQEPYSIAMILKEMSAKLPDWKIEILGTDISLEILERAKSGLYTQFEVQRGVPTNFLLTYFERVGEQWKIIDPILSMVHYRPFNLLENPAVLGKFDVVFCRNVLIYFDEPTKSRILDDVSGMLAPDGVLLLGGAESVLGLCKAFETSVGQRGIYRLSDDNGAAPRQQPPAASIGTASTSAATPVAPPATTAPAASAASPTTAPAAKPAPPPPAVPAAKSATPLAAAPTAKPATPPPAAPAAKPATPLPAAPTAVPIAEPAPGASQGASAASDRPELAGNGLRTTAG